MWMCGYMHKLRQLVDSKRDLGLVRERYWGLPITWWNSVLSKVAEPSTSLRDVLVDKEWQHP